MKKIKKSYVTVSRPVKGLDAKVSRVKS